MSRVPDHLSRTVPTRESRHHFKARVQEALDDRRLQAALRTSLTGLRAKRQRGFESFDFAAGREDLRRRREANLSRLPELIAEFAERLQEAGGQLHIAADAEAARTIIGRICREAGAGVVTKSKSMATEEIELNPYLESMGMEVVETDLGERLVQLTHTHPSHLIAPAIHLDRHDAARVFGTEPDIAVIQAEARRSLREKFIAAAVGISGANFAIAETGTIGLVTNEGNADLTTTLPPVHIALFGIDKVIATLDDAVAMLRMLPRSATGQRITSYVNWITGPSRSGDIEQSLTIGVHGPREMHCVLLYNGREAMIDDPLFASALTCIRCGACSNACPPFMAVSGHQFGHIYNGPIGLVLTPFHHGHGAVDLPQSLCCQCNACEEVCPVGIPLPRQILEHRRTASRTLPKSLLLRLWEHGAVARGAMRAAAPAVAHRPGLGGLPALAPRSLRAEDVQGLESGDGPPVTIFPSCAVEQMAPGMGSALAAILRAAGHRVSLPTGAWCCGLVAANAGDLERAGRMCAELAAQLAASPPHGHATPDAGDSPIITPSTSCHGAFTIDAEEWPGAGSQRTEVAARMRTATEFVLELLEARPGLLRPGPASRVAYHDSCQSLRQLGLHRQPRRILELCGYEVVELPDVALCCGFGGTFSVDWPNVAGRMREWKLEALAATGASILASDNPGCLIHIGAGRPRDLQPVRVAHILELVAERLA